MGRKLEARRTEFVYSVTAQPCVDGPAASNCVLSGVPDISRLSWAVFRLFGRDVAVKSKLAALQREVHARSSPSV